MSETQVFLDDQKGQYSRSANAAEFDKAPEIERKEQVRRGQLSRLLNTPIRSAISGNTAPMGLGSVRVQESEEVPGEKGSGPTIFYGGEPAMSIGASTLDAQPLKEFAQLKDKVVRSGGIQASGRIKGFRTLMERWGFTRKQAAELLGFENEGIIGELYLGIEKVQQRDVRERLKHFLSLAVDLDGLYDDDAVIGQWLDQPKKLLGGKTPRQMLLAGSVEDILRVRQFVQLEANR